ncbi:MAG: cytochrome c oxidase assembly protein [Methyloligellaceae bacterium]
MLRPRKREPGKRHTATVLALAGVVAGMLALSYAAVPLYQIFCQVTGYGGTVQQAEGASDRIVSRKIVVRFDANVARGMPWTFKPVTRPLELRLGENALADYQAHNPTNEPVSGTATFNVSPAAAGRYFNKIECFCFTEQTLGPGASAKMPVSFFVDPELENDPDTRNIREITLSYTFFRIEDADGVAAVSNGGDPKAGS